MATKVASLYADVNANVQGFISAMKEISAMLTVASSNVDKFAIGVTAAMAGATIGVAVFKQAFELGEEGAQILQTRDSFNSLASALGQGPQLLNELQAATRGTVSEFDLMNSTNQLLMGTTGELGQKLADAAPQLAAIAQAAHDLNPAMGTTAEMYDRLSRGIKKAEPELLDEVGILMNLTQVYKDYAASHGITVTAMDKTMKTEAMLNAVLTQGNTLMQQASNVNTSAADSFARLDVATTDLGNSIKERLAPPMADAAEGANLMLTWSEKLTGALSDHSREVFKTAGSYEEYSTELWRAAMVAGYWVDSAGDLRNQIGGLVQANYRLSDAEYAYAKNAQSAYNASVQLNGGLSNLDNMTSSVSQTVTANMQAWATYGETLTATAEATHYNEQAMAVYGERLTGLAGYYAELEAAEQQRIMSAGLLAGVQAQLGDATASYSMTLAQLTEQEAQITAALVEAQTLGYAPTSEKVMELNAALQQNQEAQANALSSLQNLTAEMIYQQAAAGLDTQAALDLARGMGVLSEADYVVAASIQSLREQFDLNHDSMISAAEGASDFAAQTMAITKAVQNLQAKNLPVTFENVTSELEAMSTTNASTEMENLGEAADPAAQGMTDVSGAASEAAGSLDDSASGAEDTSAALEDIGAASGKAASGIASAGSAARSATTPLRTAAAAANDLAGALMDIPGRTNISVSVSGVDAAIAELNRLAGVINSIDTSLTIYANVVSTGGTGMVYPPYKVMPPMQIPTGGTPLLYGNTTTSQPQPYIINETYNIYDPLAAQMLAANKRLSVQRRLEAVLNG